MSSRLINEWLARTLDQGMLQESPADDEMIAKVNNGGEAHVELLPRARG